MTRQENCADGDVVCKNRLLHGEECWWSCEKWRKAMKKMRLAAAALVLGSCITLGAVPASADTIEPVANQAPISTVQGNDTNGLGCIVKLWFKVYIWCKVR